MSLDWSMLRKQRRSIVNELQAQQKLDAETAKKIGACVLSNTKLLLFELRDCFSSLAQSPVLAVIDRQFLNHVAPSFSHERLRCCSSDLHLKEAKLSSTKNDLSKAQEALDAAASFGFASEWFMSEGEKKAYQQCKLRRDSFKIRFIEAEAGLNQTTAEFQAMARAFFVEMMAQMSLEKLKRSNSIVFRNFSVLLNEFSRQLQVLSANYKEAQLMSLAVVMAGVMKLEQIYDAVDNVGGH